LSVAIWIVILPVTQPEQRLRREVEIAFRKGRVEDALAIMSAHAQADFPPHWEPPPRFLKGEKMNSVLEVWEVVQHTEQSPWVRQVYAEKVAAYHRMWMRGSRVD
jgi:hypothetical protein